MKLRGYKTITIYERPKGKTCALANAKQRVIDINEECKYVHELGKDEYVQLVWTDVDCDPIQMGSVIAFHPYVMDDGDADLEDDGNLTPIYYFLTDTYEPTNVGENEWRYEPKFQSPIMLLDKIPFCAYFYENDGKTLSSRELEWSLVGKPSVFVSMILEAMAVECTNQYDQISTTNFTGELMHRAFYREDAEDGMFKTIRCLIGIDESSLNETLSFQNASVFSALGTIASTFNTEFTWMSYTIDDDGGISPNPMLFIGKVNFPFIDMNDDVSLTKHRNLLYTHFCTGEYTDPPSYKETTLDSTKTYLNKLSSGTSSVAMNTLLCGYTESGKTYGITTAQQYSRTSSCITMTRANDTRRLLIIDIPKYSIVTLSLKLARTSSYSGDLVFRSSTDAKDYATLNVCQIYSGSATVTASNYYAQTVTLKNMTGSDVTIYMNSVASGIDGDTDKSPVWLYYDSNYPQMVVKKYSIKEIATSANPDYNIPIIAGENCDNPQIQMNSANYYNRFYIFGSTRNISQEYGALKNDGSYVARLSIQGMDKNHPNPYIDATWAGAEQEIESGMIHAQSVYFDSIYPHSNLTVYTVCSDVRIYVDDNGNKTDKEYFVYFLQFHDEDETSTDESKVFQWSDDYLASDSDTPKIVFKSGLLAGYEFEFIYHSKSGKSTADKTPVTYPDDCFEIVFQEDNGVVVPGTTYLLPVVGDEATIVNIQMPDEYVESSQRELLEEGEKYIEDLAVNHNTYTFDCYPTLEGEDLAVTQMVGVGARVSLSYYDSNDEIQTFIEGARTSKVEWCLDFPTQKQITIANSEIQGTTNALEASIQTTVQENTALLEDFNAAEASLKYKLIAMYDQTMAAIEKASALWVVKSDLYNNDFVYTEYPVVSANAIMAYTTETNSNYISWIGDDFYWNNGKLYVQKVSGTGTTSLSADATTALEEENAKLKEEIASLSERLEKIEQQLNQ